MLTLDFTKSRNLSQALAGSRSRAGLVAAVITRKKCTPAISTDVHKLWKAVCLISFYRFSELRIVPRRSLLFAPVSSVRCCKISRPPHRFYPTARDCRRLKRREQAKSAPVTTAACTSPAQFFHNQKKRPRNPGSADSKGNSIKFERR